MEKTEKLYGCVRFHAGENSWRLEWSDKGKRKCKSFSVNKYGYDEAQTKALDLQEEISKELRKDEFPKRVRLMKMGIEKNWTPESIAESLRRQGVQTLDEYCVSVLRQFDKMHGKR